jgi:CheY-like chemotaxis protein
VTPKVAHVLVVEDDDDVDLMMIKRAFKKHKILNPLHVARDGIEALAQLRGTDGNTRVPRPYMILLDLNMPRMNGLELLEALPEDDELKDSIVLVLTTSDADADRTAAYDKNIAGYILKSNVGPGFLDLCQMLDCYWRVVVLPTRGSVAQSSTYQGYACGFARSPRTSLTHARGASRPV